MPLNLEPAFGTNKTMKCVFIPQKYLLKYPDPLSPTALGRILMVKPPLRLSIQYTKFIFID